MGKLPPSPQLNERELELTLALAVPLIAVHGFGSIRVEECAVRAKDLSDTSDLKGAKALLDQLA
jgi:hypothetical protein